MIEHISPTVWVAFNTLLLSVITLLLSAVALALQRVQREARDIRREQATRDKLEELETQVQTLVEGEGHKCGYLLTRVGDTKTTPKRQLAAGAHRRKPPPPKPNSPPQRKQGKEDA